MVNSPWKGQCAKCPQAERQIKAYHFERCQWQKSSQPNLWYTLYRWCLAVAFISICIYSIAKPHRRVDNSHNSRWKWPAFLTNWAYAVCTTQAILALWIVQSTWFNRTKPKDENRDLPKLYHVYWVLHNLAVDMAFVVTLIYWSLVHDTAVHRLDVLNFLVHAVNTMMMLIDMFLISHPCRLIYLLNSTATALGYLLFSYIYYISGGTDRDGRPYIYAALDWRKPGRAICFTLLSLTIMAVIHCVAYCLYRLRAHLASRIRPSASTTLSLQEKPMLLQMA